LLNYKDEPKLNTIKKQQLEVATLLSVLPLKENQNKQDSLRHLKIKDRKHKEQETSTEWLPHEVLWPTEIDRIPPYIRKPPP
jgi:hypothetical protein